METESYKGELIPCLSEDSYPHISLSGQNFSEVDSQEKPVSGFYGEKEMHREGCRKADAFLSDHQIYPVYY